MLLVSYITYRNILTNTEFCIAFSETSYLVMLCIVTLFNINKDVLLMTMGNWFLMNLRENSCLTMEFRKLVHLVVV